jgi:nicotinamide mononucleotide (NMN) deamidase PncC
MSPSDAAWQQLISTLHASGRKATLAITGGGSGAVGELLRVPGGSRLLIEAQVPYDALALATFLGFAPAQACSADTAIAMARTARAHAQPGWCRALALEWAPIWLASARRRHW